MDKPQHQYKRRTFDECMEVALMEFSKGADKHLTAAQLEYLLNEACLGGGSLMPGWNAIIGFEPNDRQYYEIRITDWLDKSCPDDTRTWVRILVSRDRSSNFRHVQWLAQSDWKPRQAGNS